MKMTEQITTSVPEVTADRLRAALDAGRDLYILDVRPREEFDEWRIPGSRHVGGYEALKAGRDDVYAGESIPDDAPIVTVCGAGRTSREAARQLRVRGKTAYSLSGGLRAWTFAWNVAEIEAPEARIVQIRRTGKGCLSYLVGSGGEAAVIDPSVEPRVYEEQASKQGWTITAVLDTHVHADHLSRGRSLTGSVGARLYLPAQERVAFEHQALEDGDTVEIGDATLTALRTPGHTPESTTYRLGESALFTGDTLFPEGVGRPDLDADAAEGRRKARQLHRSLMRLTDLPGDPVVLPGHASEPVPFDDEVVGAPLSTVEREVEALQWSEERFVKTILDRVPPTPPNHETIIRRNEEGSWPDETNLVDLEAGANRCAVG